MKKEAEYRNNNRSNIGCAVVLMLAGVIFLLFNLGVLPSAYERLFISWQMALVVIGIVFMVKRYFFGGLLMVGAGIFFGLPLLGDAFPETFGNIDFDLHTYWPVGLILLAVFVLLKGFFPEKRKDSRKRLSQNDSDFSDRGSGKGFRTAGSYIDKNTIFNSTEQIILSQNFEGGEINTIFGETIIDLRKAGLAENNRLELNVIFGSIVVYVPENWDVSMNISTIFGGTEDKRQLFSLKGGEERNPVLYLGGGCIFAGIEIRN